MRTVCFSYSLYSPPGDHGETARSKEARRVKCGVGGVIRGPQGKNMESSGLSLARRVKMRTWQHLRPARACRRTYLKFGIYCFEAGKGNLWKDAFPRKFSPKSLVSRNFSRYFIFVYAQHLSHFSVLAEPEKGKEKVYRGNLVPQNNDFQESSIF